jgi:Flp pilus assembly protein TadD
VELVARGDEFASNGDHSQAVRAYRKALEFEPNDAAIHLALGRSLAHLKGYSREAEKSLMKAIELEPENPLPLVALAKLYQSFGRRRDARDLALRALAEDPDSVEAQDLVGSLPDREQKPAEQKTPEEPGILRRFFKRDSK